MKLRLRWCAGAWVILTSTAQASPWTPEAGGGSVTTVYQYSHVQKHLAPDGEELDVGTINTQSLFVQLDYGVTDHFAVYASLPYVKKKYNGPRAHRIADEHGDVHVTEEDDGSYHGGVQDFLLGAQYQMNWGTWAITPFISYGTPSVTTQPDLRFIRIGSMLKAHDNRARSEHVKFS